MPLTYLSNGLLRAQGTNGCTGLKMMDGGGGVGQQQTPYPQGVLWKYWDSSVKTVRHVRRCLLYVFKETWWEWKEMSSQRFV